MATPRVLPADAPGGTDREAAEHCRRVLRDARSRAAERSGREVPGEVLDGGAAEALIRAGRGAAAVVVGVDQGDASATATAFAVSLTAARGVPVVAIRCWRDSALERSGVVLPLRDELDEGLRQEELDDMDVVLAPALRDHARVAVERRVVLARPQRALADASQHPALVVVGSRGRGGFSGLLLRSVSQAVLERARCTVAVVR